MKITIKKFRRNKNDSLTCDFDEMIFTSNSEIGITGRKMEFRIDKFPDKEYGFFINSSSQGNFVLNIKEMEKLIKFIKSSMLK
jgi:hypothetical protein